MNEQHTCVEVGGRLRNGHAPTAVRANRLQLFQCRYALPVLERRVPQTVERAVNNDIAVNIQYLPNGFGQQVGHEEPEVGGNGQRRVDSTWPYGEVACVSLVDEIEVYRAS